MRCNQCGTDKPIGHVCYTQAERAEKLPVTPGRLASWQRMLESAERAKARSMTISTQDLSDILDHLEAMALTRPSFDTEQWRHRALRAERQLLDVERALRK